MIFVLFAGDSQLWTRRIGPDPVLGMCTQSGRFGATGDGRSIDFQTVKWPSSQRNDNAAQYFFSFLSR